MTTTNTNGREKPKGTIFIPGKDGYFTGRLTPADYESAKVIRLATRSLALMGEFIGSGEPPPIFVLYEEPCTAFVDEMERLHGVRPIIWVPGDDAHGDVSLVDQLSEDTDLLEQMEDLRDDYMLEGIINTRKLTWLGKDVSMDVRGTKAEKVLNGLIRRCNDKAEFKRTCRQLKIATIPGTSVKGSKSALFNAAHQAFNHYGAIVLRQAYSAGGLGNRSFTVREELIDFLEVLSCRSRWVRGRTLVEPLLPVKTALSTIVEYTAMGPRIYGHADRVDNGKLESSGSLFPSSYHASILNLMESRAMEYALHRQSQGYGERFLDIDWVVLGDQFKPEGGMYMPPGMLLGAESNARWLATNTQLALRKHLAEGKGAALGIDFVRVSPTVSTSDVLSIFNTPGGIGWDQERQSGVILTNPPRDGAMSYTVLAPTAEMAIHLKRLAHGWCRATRMGVKKHVPKHPRV